MNFVIKKREPSGFLNFKILRIGIGSYSKKVNDRPTLVSTLMQGRTAI
jgi:hypothetical protein